MSAQYGLWNKNLSSAFEYFTKGTGPFSSNGLEGTLFTQTGLRPDLGGAPDLQIHFVAAAGTSRDVENFNIKPEFRLKDAFRVSSVADE